MKYKKILFSLLIIISLVSLILALPVPSPHAFYGEIRDTNGFLVDGNLTAKILENLVGETLVINGSYDFIVESEQEGLVLFYFEGELIGDYEFEEFGVTNLDLIWSECYPKPQINCEDADIDLDGNVDEDDFNILEANFGRTDCDEFNSWCSGADINEDGSVDLGDFVILRNCYEPEENETEDEDSKRNFNQYIAPQYCEPIWECSGWTECIDGFQTRVCEDKSHCEYEYNKPHEGTACEDLISPVLEEAKPFNGGLFLIGIFVVLILVLIILVQLKE